MQLNRLLEFQISKLPHWVLTDSQPAFYDTESGTTIQQTARVYAKVQELTTTYNEFIARINQYISDFENGIIESFESFKNCVIETMNEYIRSIDQKIISQNTEIAEAIKYMKDNLEQSVNDLFFEAVRDGTIVATLREEYNPETESLTFTILAVEGGNE